MYGIHRDLGGSLCLLNIKHGFCVQDSSFLVTCGVGKYVFVHTLHSIQYGHMSTQYQIKSEYIFSV